MDYERIGRKGGETLLLLQPATIFILLIVLDCLLRSNTENRVAQWGTVYP